MRISDWSSDVCSSDLSGCRAGNDDTMNEQDTLVDWTAFQQARSELGASFVRILGYFHEDGVKSVAAIEDAMRRADSAALVLPAHTLKGESHQFGAGPLALLSERIEKIGRASCRERVCQYVYISVVAVSLKKKNNISITENNHSNNKKINI